MTYHAVNTKIKAMCGGLLNERDYARMCLESGNFRPAIGDNPFLADMAKILPHLDRNAQNFVKTSRGLEKLDKSSRASMKRVLGTEADIRNILAIYRLKKFYNIAGDGVLGFLSVNGHRLNAEETTRLAYSRGVDGFARTVAEGFYGRYFQKYADFARGEQILSHIKRLQFQKEYKHNNLSVVCGYLFARLLEEKNIRAIIKGRENNLSFEEIFKLLHI